jgi:hypothetical protein
MSYPGQLAPFAQSTPRPEFKGDRGIFSRRGCFFKKGFASDLAEARRSLLRTLVFGYIVVIGFHAAQARTIEARSPSLADVSTAIAAAADGDIVSIPSGTAAWTNTLVISKGIQLIGKTATDAAAGKAVDNTVVQDNVGRGAGGRPIVRIESVFGKSYQISGITFQGFAAAANPNGAVVMAGNSHSVRIDHCHFKPMAQAVYVAINGAIFGVADHNILEFTHGESFTFHADNWPNPDGRTGQYGDGSWASPTNFGTESFFFVEDNYLINESNFNPGAGTTDDRNGGRWVFRYNHCHDTWTQTHGTESLRAQGGRAREIYNNDFHFRKTHPAGGIRSGVTITYSNTWDGAQPTHLDLQAYRSFFGWKSQALPGWGGATGDNPWDVNDTEGNGINVAGHSAYMFASGTAAAGSSKTAIVDGTKNWRPDQWAGFTAKRVSDNQVAYITGNTSNALNVVYYTDSGGGAVWKAGDQYQIHRCLVALGQPGRGQGDLIVGSSPRNSKMGTFSWPHQALEPTYSWNNFYTGGVPIGVHGTKTIQENRDYYNQAKPFDGRTGVGVGTLADRPSSGLVPGVAYWASDNKTLYVADSTTTWRSYYKPYTYPHPLVGGSPPPTSTPSPAPAATPNPPTNLTASPVP